MLYLPATIIQSCGEDCGKQTREGTDWHAHKSMRVAGGVAASFDDLYNDLPLSSLVLVTPIQSCLSVSPPAQPSSLTLHNAALGAISQERKKSWCYGLYFSIILLVG